MNKLYDLFVTRHQDQYRAALEVYKERIDQTTITVAPDLELISFDLVPIHEIFETSLEQSNREIHYNTMTYQKLLVPTGDNMKVLSPQ